MWFCLCSRTMATKPDSSSPRVWICLYIFVHPLAVHLLPSPSHQLSIHMHQEALRTLWLSASYEWRIMWESNSWCTSISVVSIVTSLIENTFAWICVMWALRVCVCARIIPSKQFERRSTISIAGAQLHTLYTCSIMTTMGPVYFQCCVFICFLHDITHTLR